MIIFYPKKKKNLFASTEGFEKVFDEFDDFLKIKIKIVFQSFFFFWDMDLLVLQIHFFNINLKNLILFYWSCQLQVC